ncbi:MAG TPA: PD-(D/E)XK nuclease family protein [Candidatus Dormibacteraeota bacterium]|nr:PD-(D/E)XK nuclease family protein [Candidatus Dormibacteraeota bacterium]
MTPAPLALSFSRINLFTACPLKYRYLEVDGAPEPDVRPDWAHAPPRLALESIASHFDRSLGAAVHAALSRWQHAADGGAPGSADRLLDAVRLQATAAGLAGTDLEPALRRLEPGLRTYAKGEWPRRATLFLEHNARHTLVGADGFAVELHLRVDRVARYRRGVAIIDFKTVTPHAFEMRGDQWQLRTYALAAPGLLGVAAASVHLFVIDLLAGSEHAVSSDRAALDHATAELVDTARSIAAADFDVSAGHADRPCWSCGFRLTCPASLAPAAPRT